MQEIMAPWWESAGRMDISLRILKGFILLCSGTDNQRNQ
jgi:hypothetical protein